MAALPLPPPLCPSPSAMSALLVLCTCPDRGSADAIARRLVESHQAACVGILPGMVSVYRWQGAIEQADEVQLLIKTSSARYSEVEATVLAMHPYELPELIAVEPVAGLQRYLDWIQDETAPGATDPA